MIYKQKIKVNMTGRGWEQLEPKEKDWLNDNHLLLRHRVVEIVGNHKEQKAPCNTRIAKDLFPPDGDNDQNFTCRKLLDKMEGEELISKKDGEQRKDPRRWYLTEKGKTMLNQQKAQEAINLLKEAIKDEIEKDPGIMVPDLSKKLDIEMGNYTKHSVGSHNITWSIVCTLEKEKKIRSVEADSVSKDPNRRKKYHWHPK